jgi:phage nucleotide-binding protein
MADKIDILNIEPTKISRDLKGKFVLIYGEAKSGKTSFSSLFPKPLLCAFERGYNALPGVKAIDISRWTDFKKVCAQLKKPDAQNLYETIIIDTVGIATDMCEKYILAQNDVEALSDVPWGGGWSQYKKEFENTLRELTYLGYGIVFIAHSKTKPTKFKDSEGEVISCVYPDITNTGMNIVNRLVDVISYLAVEFDDRGVSSRFLYTRQTPYIFAGSRYKYLEEKIPFGYTELVNAIADSIEKQIEIDGATVTDSTVIKPVERRDFNSLMSEARELWKKLTEGESEEENEKGVIAIMAIVKKHLGREIRISQITPNQQDILELIVEEMKEL